MTTPDSLPEEAVEAAILEAHRVLYREVTEEVLKRGGDKDLTRCVRAAILAYQRASWCFDMEKAPRDKTTVSVAWWRRDMNTWIVGEAYFDPKSDGWWWANDYHADKIFPPPRAWQPLPAPPPAQPTTEGEK